MSHRCQKCGKGIQYGHFVSHAKNRVLRVFQPNLKRITVMVDGKKQRMILCTSCVRAFKKQNFK